MPQISFTKNNEQVYDRFSRLLLEEQLKRGKLTAPQFLDLLLDLWFHTEEKKLIEKVKQADAEISLLKLLEATKDLDGLTPDEIAALDEAIEECSKPVSLRAYIADAEANDPSLQKVVIKQSDGAQYLEKMLAHNHNAYLTPHRSEAMVFDSRDQAKAFLRKCGYEVGNWILEPVNESK